MDLKYRPKSEYDVENRALAGRAWAGEARSGKRRSAVWDGALQMIEKTRADRFCLWFVLTTAATLGEVFDTRMIEGLPPVTRNGGQVYSNANFSFPSKFDEDQFVTKCRRPRQWNEGLLRPPGSLDSGPVRAAGRGRLRA